MPEVTMKRLTDTENDKGGSGFGCEIGLNIVIPGRNTAMEGFAKIYFNDLIHHPHQFGFNDQADSKSI